MDRDKDKLSFKQLCVVGIFTLVLSRHVTYGARVTGVSPRYGSLAGETRLTVFGSGFSADQFSQNDDPNVGNKVYLVGESGSEVACLVHKDGTTEDQVMCYTPEKMSQQSYYVKVVVDGTTVPDGSICGGNPTSWSCTHVPKSDHTPTVTAFSSHSGKPGDFITMTGKLFTDRYGSNMDVATNSKEESILRVYTGPTDCLLKDGDNFYGLALDGEDSDKGSLKCKTQGKSVGFYNASFIVQSPYGRSLPDSELYRVSYKDDIYLYQVYTDISSISPNTGSTAGGLKLTINGNYFDDRAPYVAPKAYVGDTECVVTNVVLDQYIECTVATDPAYTATKYAGNRGVNFEYWTSTSQSNLDDILAMTSSDPGYVSSTLDETYHYDVNDTMDTYVSRMTTYFTPPHSGEYQFQLKGDDAARLFVDGVTTVSSSGSWGYSSRMVLTKGTRYLLEVVHREDSGTSMAHLRVKFFETKFTNSYLGNAKQEKQTLAITSTVVYEEQELTFSGFSSRSSSNEIQTVEISTDSTFRIGLFGVFTEPLDINTADDGTVGTAFNALPVFSSDESVSVTREAASSGATFKFTFNSNRGDFPNIEVIRTANGSSVSYQVTENSRGSPDMDTVALKYAGRVSKPFNVDGLTASTLKSVVSGMFEAKCPEVFSKSAKHYEDYESSGGKFWGSITKDTDAFCGRYALINPGRIFRKNDDDLGIAISTSRTLCFAYKGLLRDYIWFEYSYRDATSEETVTRTDAYANTFSKDSPDSSSTWYYTCFDMYTNIMRSRPSDSNHRVEQIWVARDSTQDIYIDSLYIGGSATTTDSEVVQRRLAPAMPNGAIIGSETVAMTSAGVFMVTLKPVECGYSFPLFELGNGQVTSGRTSSSSNTATLKLQNGGSGSVIVVRKNEASPPVEGFVDITFNGHTRQRLNVSLEADQFQKELETLNSIGALSVTKNGDCANFDLAVTFESLPGDLNEMTVNLETLNSIGALSVNQGKLVHCANFDLAVTFESLPVDLNEMTVNSGSLSGINAAGSISTNVHGGLFMDPLPGDMLATVHSTAQVRLLVNDVPVGCPGDCSFEWHSSATPTVTGVSPNSGTSALSTSTTITGTGFSSVNSENTVTIGGVACAVTAATTTSITCSVGNGPVGSHRVVVTVKDKGEATTASSGVFEYTADISSISPSTGSLGGGVTLTITGYGFKSGSTVSINSQDCAVLTLAPGTITCTVPAQTSAGTYDVEVSSAGSTTLSYSGYMYDASLTPLVSGVSPSSIGVAGGQLTISGSSFGSSEGTVKIGQTSATVSSWSDSQVVVDVPAVEAGSQEVKVDTLSGFALTNAKALPTVSVDLSITNVYPLQGSIQGGTRLTLSGSGFGTNASLVGVSIGNVGCNIETIANAKIECMIGNAGTVHQVTNRGTHRAYGIYYAYDRPFLTINRGDFVQWSWETPDFVNNVAHAIIEVDTPSSLEAKVGGFTSGTPTKNGQYRRQFSQIGTYYVWSGYVDAFMIKNYVGTIEVVDAVSSVAQVDVTIAGKSARHVVGGSSDPSDTSSCSSVTSIKSSCSDPRPTATDNTKFHFAFWTCSTPIISSVSARNGTVQTDITLNGEGLSSTNCQNEVTVDQTPCTVTAASASSVTCNMDKVGTPALGIIQPFSVRVGNRGYAIWNIAVETDRSFALLPSVESITPTSGSLAGGAVITITGFGFGNSPMVTVGGFPCTIVSSSYSSIQCETPMSTSQATRDIEVKTMINSSPFASACETTTQLCNYIYSTALTSSVTGVSPSSLAAPTTLTINGTGLGTVTSDLQVLVGGVAGTVTSASDTQIQVSVGNIPAGSNPVHVSVKDYGRASGSLTVTGTASISSVSPPSGSIHGNQLITVQGNGFVENQTSVTLDGAVCNITAISLSQLTCRTQAHAAGSVSLAVTSNSVTYTPDSFSFSTAVTPTITSVSPTAGLPGSTLTIAGSNLVDGTVTVTLDGVPCVVTSSTANQVQCTLGNHGTGSVSVSMHVENLGASNTDVMFEYQLSLTSINPTQGGTAGGQKLTLTGTGFTDMATVTVCSEPCPRVNSTSSDYVCKTPSVSAQTCDVAITVNGLTKTLATAYTYDGSLTPTVTGVTPTRGGTGGGTTITVTGTGFGSTKSDTSVEIDGAACVVAGVTNTQITCETGAHQGSLKTKVDVEIGGNGIAQASSPAAVEFEYIDVWSSNFTWGGGPLPMAGEFIIIPAGQTILLDTDTPVLKFLLIQGGKLIFDEKDIELQSEIIMITDQGQLQVGTETAPFQHKGIITLHGHHRSKELPIYGTKVLAVRNGTLDLHGIEVPLTWSRLASTAAAGTNTLTLVDPVEWNVGDEIVIAASGHHHTQSENENKKITAISGDKMTLTLDSALEARHYGEQETFDGTLVEFRAEVGLLTHNVVVRGNTDPQWEDEIKACEAGFNTGEFATQTCFLGRFGDEIGSSQFGGMILVHSPVKDTHEAEAKISYTEVTFGGQAFRLGRYPIHFHLNGDMSTSYVRGCGIHKTFNRAVNIHGTHNTIVEKTVIYNIMGGAFFLEDGIETGNTFQYNLAVFVRESSSLLNDDVTPASFWLTNPNNTVQHNAAAGGSHFGYWYRMHDHPDGPSFTSDVCCKTQPLGVFYNNSAHSFGWFGLWTFPDFFPKQGGCGGTVAAPAVFRKFFAWNNEKGAETVNGGALQFEDCVFVQNKKAGYEGKKVSGPKYTDDSAMVNSTLIVGKTTVIPDNTQGCTNGGIVFPYGFGFQVKNTRFVNFADSCSAMAFARIDGTCVDGCGGFHYMTEQLKFVNAPNKVTYAWDWEGILIDRDGTLTGKPNYWQVLPTTGTLPSDCEHAPAFSMGVPASVCPDTYKFHRFAFNKPTPESLEGKNFIITNQYGNSSVRFLKKRITHKFGWMCNLVGGETYDFVFEHAEQITNISYVGSFYDFETGNWVAVKMPLKEVPDRFSLDGGSSYINHTDNLDPPNAKNGDWTWLNSEKKVKFLVHGTQRSKRATVNYGADRPLSFTTFKCFYTDCIPPPDPNTVPPTAARSLDFDYWVDGALWNDTGDGYITADPTRNSTYGVPQIMDDVKIPYGMWVVINGTNINKLGTLVLYGVLEVIDNPGVMYEINADFIIILGGRLVAGWPDDPFATATLSIVLRGNHSSPIFNAGDGPNVGSKAIGVFGGLDLFGKDVGVTWTQLAATATAGANQIVLKDQVTWTAGDEIVLGPTSYDVWQTETFRITAVATDNVTLTLNDTLRYRHIAHSETINSQQLELGAAVGLLTRNIKIIGEDYADLYSESFGARVIVGLTVMGTQIYTGYSRLSNVEFYHTGQEGFTEEYDPRFSVAYVATGTVSDIKPSFVTKCAFRNNFNTAIGAFGIKGLNITDNVVFHTVGNSIATSSDNTRLINNLAVLMVWTGSYQDRQEPFNFRWEASIEAMTARNVTLQGNLVSGSERIGYHVSPIECGDVSGRIANNVAQSNFMGYVVLPEDGIEVTCAEISGFTSWKSHDFGIYYQSGQTVKIKDNVVVDNRQGIFTLTAGPAALSHAVGTAKVEISNMLVVGATSSFDCNADVAVSDDNAALGGNGRPSMAPGGGKIGIVFPNFMSGGNSPTIMGFAGILNYPAIAGLMTFTDITFAHYDGSCKGGDFAVGTSGDNEDGQHPIEATRITFVDVAEDNKIVYHRPSVGKINSADCVDMDCDAKKKALFRDMDGSFIGSPGAVLPQSEFEWGGDPRRGLGDYRIPKEMVTDLSGNRIAYSTLMPNKGVIRSPNCTFINNWKAYKCFDYNWEMLILESMDSDTETRRISPVAILGDGYVDLINGPQDHGWCSGYTCRKRISTFMAIVATDFDYLVHFTGTTPERMRYHLLNVDAYQGIKLTVWYSRPNRLDVYVDGNYVMATNAEVNQLGYYVIKMPVGNEFTPMIANATGTNYFDRDSGLLSMIIKGSSVIEVKTQDVIIVSFGLPAMTVTDFFGDNLVENIAAFFNIPLTKVRIVNVVSASSGSGRRKRSTGINVDVEIGDEPSSDPNATVSNSVTRNDLVNIASDMVNECQVGNVSSSLNVSGNCQSVEVPGETAESSTVRYSTPSPAQLVFYKEAIPIYEGYLLQQQPKLQATDAYDVVVTELGTNEYPWKLTVSIRPGTGHPDAVLAGSLTVNASNGWFNFTDLEISHMGTGYILDYNVTFPTVAENFTLASSAFDVAGRPIKPYLVPANRGGDLEPSTQFAVTLGLKDSNNGQVLSNITWRSHTWSASARILGNPRYGGIGGIVNTNFDPSSGQAIFPDLRFTHFGMYYVQLRVESNPPDYNLTLNHKVIAKNPKFANKVQEKQSEISVKFDVNYDTVLPDEDKQNEFEQYMIEDFSNRYVDVDFQSAAIRRGSIVITFVIAGNTSDVNTTAYSLCDSVSNSSAYSFDSYSLTLSTYMTIDNQTFYGVSCHITESEDDDGLGVGVIAGIAVAAVIVVAVIVGLIVWLACIKPKTKTHNTRLSRLSHRRSSYHIYDMKNNMLFDQDKKTGDLYFKENSFVHPGAARSPPPPISTLYNTPYVRENRPPSGISVHLRTPEPSEAAKLERHLQTPESTFMSTTSSRLDPRLVSEATYYDQTDPRSPSPAVSSRGSGSPVISRSHSPFNDRDSPLPPVGEKLYEGDYIRKATPKVVSPYLAAPPKPRK